MKNKKTLLFIVVVFILLSMTVGFSILSSNLSISGNVDIISQTWDMYFDNIIVSNNSKTPNSISIDSNDVTKVNFNVTMDYGEYLEFTVDANNSGTLNAIIGTINLDLSSYSNNLSYTITYLDGTELALDQLLNIGTKEKYRVKINYNLTQNGTINLIGSFDVNYIYLNAFATTNSNFNMSGMVFDSNDQPISNGTVLIDNITSNIVDGMYTIKNVTSGNHQLIVKDNSNNIIGNTNFNIIKGTIKSDLNNNITTDNYYSNELNIMLTSQDDTIITFNEPLYTINLSATGATIQNSVLISRNQSINLETQPIDNYIYKEANCTNGQSAYYDNSNDSLVIRNVTNNATCEITFDKSELET